MSIETVARNARAASLQMARIAGAERTTALHAVANALRDGCDGILEANERDVAAGHQKGLAPSFLDRLTLTRDRVNAMARAVDQIAGQDDPIGRIEHHAVQPNGLSVARVRIPLGAIAVIYEARPNVTSDAAALSIRSGNAIVLKGGSDAQESNSAIGDVVRRAVVAAGLPEHAVQVLARGPREDIRALIQFDDCLDLVIPRGGEGLIRAVTEASRVPVIQHYKGVCHVYVDRAADVDRARAIILDGKVSRPSVCNSVETVLVHADISERFVPSIVASLHDSGVTVHGCERSRALGGDRVVPARLEDWAAEYLSLDVALRVVDSYDAAVNHIAEYASDHTEAIVTQDVDTADAFVRDVRSSCVMVNASTRFADGGELGLGAEIGISTSRLHAYGPMGANELTTTRFVVRGSGHTRG